MTDEESLSHLLDLADSLEKTIKDLDYQMERAAHAIAEGPDSVGHAISVLQDRQNAQAGYMYELGKVEAKIEHLQNRLRERGEQQLERHAVEDGERDVPSTAEEWLRSVLDAPNEAPKHDTTERDERRESEERLLEDMEREGVEPEDYHDWWQR